jgi:hypothetical protein
MVPIDSKLNTIIIDDMHLSSNFKTEYEEWFYSWMRYAGYFDSRAGVFKEVSKFGFVAT